ncbi:MAG: TonB-dependent receptor [Bacteroidales bacterium]|nr:TonB-dependent receptor [Bacteroidales bacterium]
MKKLLQGLWLLSLLLLCAPVWAQSVRVSGTVLDNMGEPIPGAVLVGPGNANAITDLDGKFSLSVPAGSEVKASCMGYLPYSFKAKAATEMKVTLMEDHESLEESVVVGYGVQKKAVITGSVTNISAKSIATTTANDLVTKLQGKVSGLNIRNNTATPGAYDHSINIRGFGGPLYVIDGITRDGTDFNKLNAEDIESITVLKDASAAIYGINAGNGVLIVTTKAGSNHGQARFQFNANVGLSQPTDRVRMADAYEYYWLRNAANINAGDPEYISPEELEAWRTGEDTFGKNGAIIHHQSNDWYEATFKPFSVRQEYSLSADGGVKGVKYYFNVNYSTDNGLLKSGDINYDKWSFRSVITADLAKDLQLSANVSGYMDDRWDPAADMFNVFRGAVCSLPFKPVFATFDIAPYDAWPYYNAVKEGQSYNPVAQSYKSEGGYHHYINNAIQSVFALTYTPTWLPGLEMKGTVSFDKRFAQTKILRTNWKMYTYDEVTGTVADEDWNPNTQIKNTDNYLHVYNYQAQVNYKKEVKQHHIGASAIFEAIVRDNDWNSINKYFDFFTNAEIDYAGDHDQTTGGNEDHQRKVGFIGRFNYDYAGRYLLEAAVRRDGSYRYHPDVRWGTFPVVSAGWRISEENWFKNSVQWISNLKLRASWGILGEDAGDAFQFISGYGISGGGWWEYTPGVTTNGVTSPGLVNEHLSWLKSYMADIGLDLGFFDNKLSLTVDVFQKDKTGLLARRNVELPNTFGASFPQENLNSNRTLGIEFSFDWQHRFGEFFYSVAGNATFGRTMNRYVERAPYTSSWSKYRDGNDYRWSGLGWAYNIIGQFQSYEQIENYAIYSGSIANKYIEPGDWMYEDVNGDGVIDGDDLRPISLSPGASPIWNYGLTLSGSWRGLDFSVLFQGAAGFTAYYSGPYAETFWLGGNLPAYMMDSWHHEDLFDSESPWVPGFFPSVRYGEKAGYNNAASSYTYKNCSYVRLKNIELGYTFRKQLLKKAHIDKARIFLNVNNPVTFCNPYIKAFDPEKVAGQQNLGWNYPLLMTINTGVNLNF